MELSQLFFQRYDPLCNFYLADIWQRVSYDLMIERPHPRVNSIAWILWHMARGEDVGVNRFIADNKQVLEEGNWTERMNIPYRHHGSEMSSTEVDNLNTQINMDGLHGYILAVQARTREVVSKLTMSDMDMVMDEAYLRKIMVEEEVAHTDPEGFIQNYLPWNKGKILFTLAITHPYQHMGEIFAIATFLGVSFD